MAELEAFKEAKVVKVNLDKAHERVRLEVIQVTTLRFRSQFLIVYLTS